MVTKRNLNRQLATSTRPMMMMNGKGSAVMAEYYVGGGGGGAYYYGRRMNAQQGAMVNYANRGTPTGGVNMFRRGNGPAGFYGYGGGGRQQEVGFRSRRGGVLMPTWKTLRGSGNPQFGGRGRGVFARGARRGRGASRAGAGQRGNFQGASKEALDMDLEKYMGDDALKGRLDNALDSYFGRSGNAAAVCEVDGTAAITGGTDAAKHNGAPADIQIEDAGSVD